MPAEGSEENGATPRRTYDRLRHARGGAASVGLLGLILAVIALPLGAAGLGNALVGSGHNGATGATRAPGATGPQGPAGTHGVNGTNGAKGTNGINGTNGFNGTQGPAGPGAVVNQTFAHNFASFDYSTCTVMSNSAINITATSPGTIVVTASVVMEIRHYNGNYATYAVSLWLPTSPCNPLNYSYVEGTVVASEPSAYFYPDLNLVPAFSVPAAGTYEIAVIGDSSTGGTPSDSVYFFSSSAVGVFYPS